MKINVFKSQARKKAEQNAAFERKKAEQNAAFEEFLRSDRGRRLLVELFAGTSLVEPVQAAIGEAKARLESQLAAEIWKLHRQIRQEFTDEQKEIPKRAAEIRQNLIDSLAQYDKEVVERSVGIRQFHIRSLTEHEKEVVELTKALCKKAVEEVEVLSKKAIEEVLAAHLHDLIRREVRNFVRDHPVPPAGLTNRQLAAANGISIREVKRRRRRGYF